ncbi:hypothetical protein LOZ58_001405 [Ophidiomyces ophidiicola]|nr:hypothetical protein LOZ58_001405 [Ophidiomyces ophidiicola]
MPPRRPHKKSRNGCDQCKRRRVKCDEDGPPCTQCRRREIACAFSRPASTAVSSPSVPPSQPHELEQQQHEPQREPPEMVQGELDREVERPLARQAALRDLELMHHFATDTYRSLCIEDSEQHAWQIVLPRKALGYDFLMDGMLALAALHRASALPAPAALSYVDTALQYYNRALAPFRRALDTITPVNCEPLLAHSVITTALGLALPHTPAGGDDASRDPRSPTEHIVFVFELLQGVGNIFIIARAWLGQHEGSLFASKSDFWARAAAAHTDDDTERALRRLAALNDAALDTAQPRAHRANQDAIALLLRCCRRFVLVASIDAVLAWLALVDKGFVAAVQRRQPLPVLILMHWAVLLHQLDGQRWWARNAGRALIVELAAAVQPTSRPLEEALAWPQRRIGL